MHVLRVSILTRPRTQPNSLLSILCPKNTYNLDEFNTCETMQTLKILSLCASLFSPGLDSDPHGRSLHLQTPEGFNTAYQACITTARESINHGVDPFVALAAVYYTTRMSPKQARKSRVHRHIRLEWECPGTGRWLRSSCSPFILSPIHMRTLLNQTVEDSPWEEDRMEDYTGALCRFLSPRGNCTSKYRRKARRVARLATRFAAVYRRTHTYFVWQNPFGPKPTPTERWRKRHRQDREREHQYELNLRNHPELRLEIQPDLPRGNPPVQDP